VDDPKGKEGLAHLAEHLAFRGAPDGRGRPRVFDQLIASGMAFNAFTAHDHTDYWEIGKPEDLAAALSLEAARLRDPLAGVSEDDLAIERDVVVSEYRERFETDPEGMQVQWLLERAFPGHAYGRPVGGTPESLGHITLGDVRAWLKDRYQPAATVLVLVSPVPAREAAALVLEKFGALATGDGGLREDPVSYRPPGLPPPPGEELPIARHGAPVTQARLWVGWVVPGLYAHRSPHTFAVATALGGALRAKVADQRLTEEVTDVDTNFFEMDGAGVVLVRIGLQRPKDAERALAIVKDAAFVLRTSDYPRQRTVLAVRDYLLVQSYLQMERLSAPAISEFLRAFGSPDYLGGWQKLVAGQLSFDIDKYANTFLTRDRAIPVLVVPDRNLSIRSVSVGRPGAATTADELEDEASQLQAPGMEKVLAMALPPGLDRAERRTLPNGLTAVVAKKGTLPVAQVSLVVRTDAEGTPGVPPGLPRVALGASRAKFLARQQLKVGAGVQEHLAPEYLVRAERGSSSNLDVLLEGVARWARDLEVTSFLPARYAHERFAKRSRQATDVLARRSLLAGLFPGHAYAAFPTPEEVEQLREGQADDWLSRELRPGRATLLVVSDQEPGPELWSAIEDEFGGWSTGDGSLPVAPAAPPLPSRRTVVLIDRPSATQALLSVGYRAPACAGRDEPAFDAIRWLLRSRLNRRIRIEEGVSYGVEVYGIEWREAAALVATTAVDRAAAASSLGTMLEAARSLAAKPVDDRAASRARWQVARQYAFEFDTVANVTPALEKIAWLGLPLDYFERMPPSIATLGPERIQATARTLTIEREAVVVVGDRRVLEPQLRKAGFELELAAQPGAEEVEE
jgi:zinc protease